MPKRQPYRCEHEHRTRKGQFTWTVCDRPAWEYEDHEYRTGARLRLFYCARHRGQPRAPWIRVVGRGPVLVGAPRVAWATRRTEKEGA